VYGKEAKARGRWFVFGLVVGIAWATFLFTAIAAWGNGAGLVACAALLPVIVLERWFVVRSRETGPAQ
jgi:hypothetical protein